MKYPSKKLKTNRLSTTIILMVVVRRIIDAFAERKGDDASIAAASLSAGLTMSAPDDAYSIVYYEADRALYDVRQDGQAGYAFYNRDSEPEEAERADVERIVSGIHKSGSYNGALEVEYRQFVRLYEYISNLDRRFSHPFKLILILLEPAAGETPQPIELEREMGFMERSIRQSIRNVDILTKYGKHQFLIILPGADPAGARLTIDRIFRDYYKMNGSSVYAPSYFIADMENNTPSADLPAQSGAANGGEGHGR